MEQRREKGKREDDDIINRLEGKEARARWKGKMEREIENILSEIEILA